jgi:protein-S-isoprenylcysteine O-methyltransferase Ste14
MTVNLKLLTGQIVGLFVVLALILFGAAGTFTWTAGWAFLILFFGGTMVITLWLLKNNPGLLNERMSGMVQKEQKTWDKIGQSLTGLVFIGWLIFMAFDAERYGWSQMPGWVQVVGGVIFLAGFTIIGLTFRENSFLSPVVRVQEERGQTVVSTGPYHYVRHPMYAGFMLFVWGAALLLGSWYGLIPGLLLIVMVSRRAVMEESTLRQELQGYDSYMNQVKYRLIPGVW